jgi:endonuclease/exonuclease/phosphatase family metal-dependent hydrolase
MRSSRAPGILGLALLAGALAPAFGAVSGVVFGAVAGTTVGAIAAQAPVRVTSFNIRYGTANDGDHRWERRRDALFATLRDHAPHLLGVQEALRSQLDEIASAVPGYVEVGVGRDDGRTRGEYAAILVDTARFTLVGSGTFWLSETPEVPGSMHWGNRITRITTWARVRDRVTGDTVRVLNAHWDHESQPSRERSAEALLAAIGKVGARERVVVMGDFNADESNPAFQRLVGSETGLRETFRAVHPTAVNVGTFHGFRGDSTGGKIDAVLVGGGWSVLGAGIDRSRWGGVLASDHFAVWAVIERR